MGRVLLIIASSSYRARAFVNGARTLGTDLTVASDHHQVLSRHAPGATLFVDLADPRHTAAQITAFARHTPVDAIVAADDEGVLPAACAARALGLVHNPPRAVAAARDKLLMRRALHAAGIGGPDFRLVDLDADLDDTASQIAYPCVVKPRTLSASRGVIRADEPGEFVAACRRIASILHTTGPVVHPEHRGTALVEDYVPGHEVAVEGLLENGRLRVVAMMDKPLPMEGPFFEETMLTTPSRLTPREQEDIVLTVERAARALGLRHGPVHGEVRTDGSRCSVIEMAPRSIGGLCSRCVPAGDGESLETLILRAALGMPAPASPIAALCGASGVMMIPIPAGGLYQGVTGVACARAVKGIDDVLITVAPGDRVVPLPEGGRYLGFIFASHDSPREVERALLLAHRCLTFRIG